jgi:hypothetical protein
MLAVLREEAEREARARREEGTSAVETQPDLGLPPPQPAPAEPAEPAVPPAVPGEEAAAALHDDDDSASAGRGPRRELLPDIEEINSTLSAASGRTADDGEIVTPETVRRRKGGFRMGFSLSLLAAVLLLALYVLAPSIAARVPALAPALANYVATVDSGRMWIDEMMRSSTEALKGGEEG